MEKSLALMVLHACKTDNGSTLFGIRGETLLGAWTNFWERMIVGDMFYAATGPTAQISELREWH